MDKTLDQTVSEVRIVNKKGQSWWKNTKNGDDLMLKATFSSLPKTFSEIDSEFVAPIASMDTAFFKTLREFIGVQ